MQHSIEIIFKESNFGMEGIDSTNLNHILNHSVNHFPFHSLKYKTKTLWHWECWLFHSIHWATSVAKNCLNIIKLQLIKRNLREIEGNWNIRRAHRHQNDMQSTLHGAMCNGCKSNKETRRKWTEKDSIY